MPIDIAWDDLVAQFARKGHGTKQRPALKGAASSRGTVSPVMPFIGPHPDTGAPASSCLQGGWDDKGAASFGHPRRHACHVQAPDGVSFPKGVLCAYCWLQGQGL